MFATNDSLFFKYFIGNFMRFYYILSIKISDFAYICDTANITISVLVFKADTESAGLGLITIFRVDTDPHCTPLGTSLGSFHCRIRQ